MIECTFISAAEYRERNEARIAALNAHPHDKLENSWTPEYTALSRSFLPIGTMWFCPWLNDPEDPDDALCLAVRRAEAEAVPRQGSNHLSIHYWRDWADKRPPINVVGPGYRDWCVDQVSSNGTGWTVTGWPPRITCSPSIWLAQGKPDSYHGYLVNGVFGAPV